MKTKTKALLLSLCAILLVVTSVFGTMAYLTSQADVSNTFSVGKVNITMDEEDVDNSTSGASRDTSNAYLLMPGITYPKDPIVHVRPDSESCYIFVKVENGIAAFEAATAGDYTNIAGQISANGWTPLDGVANVYYKEYVKGQEATDLTVFTELKIADNANDTSGWDQIDDLTINVTAYAVQHASFNNAEEAWAETFGKGN
mgnify:CR=1 FL=1